MRTTAAITLALITTALGYTLGRRLPTSEPAGSPSDQHPPGLPYLATDLEQLLTFTNEVIAAIEQDRLGEGPEIDNLEDTATSVLQSCRWLEKQKNPHHHAQPR